MTWIIKVDAVITGFLYFALDIKAIIFFLKVLEASWSIVGVISTFEPITPWFAETMVP